MTIGIMGQSKPAATTDDTLYTVPVGKQFVASSLSVAEVDGNDCVINIHVVPDGDSAGPENAITFASGLEANTHYGFAEGWTLAAGDSVVVQSDTGEVTFTLFGEVTNVS